MLTPVRRRMHPVWAAALVAAGALLGSGCGQPRSGQGDAPPLLWQARQQQDLPEDVRRWVEEHKSQLGIFQQTFGEQTFILVAWGERPTAGYAVEVRSVERVDTQRLRLTVRLSEPGPGDAVAQIVTYPQAVVSVKPAGYYRLDPRFEGASFLKNAAFEIAEPRPFAQVGKRVRVRGKARVFEATFRIRIEDGHDVLADRSVMASEGAPGWGDFDVEVVLDRKPSSPNGVIVIYEVSAKDGSPIHSLVIPVEFAPWG